MLGFLFAGNQFTSIVLVPPSTIANGIAFGFISYAGLKLFTGRSREVPVIVWIIAAVSVLRYVYLGSE